jgi:hypothetical protein
VGRVRCEREIKRSKFIAIAASVPDERAAMSFLNEVSLPRTLFIFLAMPESSIAAGYVGLIAR